MEQSLFEKMDGTYRQEGDYLVPNLVLDTEEQRPIGIWGQRHLHYIKHHRRVFYINLLTGGKLNSYLFELNADAEEMFSRLVEQMSKQEGITEKLKAENQMEWVGKMNNIRSRATEIVNSDLIYA